LKDESDDPGLGEDKDKVLGVEGKTVIAKGGDDDDFNNKIE